MWNHLGGAANDAIELTYMQISCIGSKYNYRTVRLI